MKRYTIKRELQTQYAVDYARALNEEQYRVVASGLGPKLVIAGAGSGKTRTVTYRVARLIESGVPGSRILVVTFTNRAAREMLGRVESLVRGDVRRVWGGTFHSVANRLLRRHAESLGYSANYTILDSEDAADLVDTAVDEAAIDTRARRFPKAAVLRDIFSYATNTGQSIGAVLAIAYPYFEPLASQIERVEYLYQQRKRERNSMDYDDLLVNWRRLMLENAEVSRAISDQFQHVLVDEYQDTNTLQAEIVDLVAAAHRNLMVVGDDAQSIYGWRGAHIGNMLTFGKRYPDAEEYRLESNYRSTPEILTLANASIAQNRAQLPKQLRAIRPASGYEPALVPLRDAEQQAAFVASRVLELRDEGMPLSEVSVLYRSHWHALELQLELSRRNIPYSIRSGLRFFEQAHIKDVISYLRLVVNPRDELAWKRVLRLIPRVGARTAARIWERLAIAENPLALVRAGTVESAPAGDGWARFAALVGALIAPGVAGDPAKQIETILQRGYLDHLQGSYENADAREEDLRQLARFATQFDSTEAFLSDLALVNTERFGEPGGTAGEDIVEGADEDERLVLSSIHQAKGLEWRAVFVIWASDGRFPSARSLRTADSEEEERRLFYVAITRARDQLAVCYPLTVVERTRETVIQKPSRFVTEVSPALFQVWEIDEQTPDPSDPELEEGEPGGEPPLLVN
ncbi:MAG TPA: ATP-dependent helicase [Blastocatellia bacterium]|nr:ATP-dependent helicase [Blastocatellia bacterium]